MEADIRLLADHFIGKAWNRENQLLFTRMIGERDEEKGKRLSDGNRDIAARDRINRSPKKFGFVVLKPTIRLTPAGEALLASRRTEEVFLRQFLKYQLPSPYHQQREGGRFRVKPYLELLRLIRHCGMLTFDEMRLFGLQLTDYRKFDEVTAMIDDYRKRRAVIKGSYKRFIVEETKVVVGKIYSEATARGRTTTRQSGDSSLDNFLATKARNMKDYADAIFRHLRATGMVEISQSGHSLSITAERTADVDYILSTIDREPIAGITEDDYIKYLGDVSIPLLRSDDKERLRETMREEFPTIPLSEDFTAEQMKERLAEAIEGRKRRLIEQRTARIKNRLEYDDIVEKFEGIRRGAYYDNALMMEWNAWRAVTMMDGGEVRANIRFDDKGEPLSVAPGNKADIECDYGRFGVTVEVTLTSGQRQFAAESEPVPRHVGRLRQQTGKQTYCLFIAPVINDATIAYFYSLHFTRIDLYGGDTIIVPMELSTFEAMIANTRKAGYTPSPEAVEAFFTRASQAADRCGGGDGWKTWYRQVTDMACSWPGTRNTEE